MGRRSDPAKLEKARALGRAAKPDREAAQRELLAAGMTEAAAELGYEACRVDDVLERSGLSRSTFYRHFGDKEACFLAAVEQAASAVFAETEEAMEAASEEPGARVEAALRELLGRLASDPSAARLLLVEARAATTVCREAHEEWLERFTRLFEAAMPMPEERSVARLTVGAATATLSMELREKGVAALPAALPQLLYLMLAPFLGPGAASERARRAGGNW